MLFSFITKWAIKRQLKRRQSDGFCPFGGAKRLVLMAQGKDVQSLLPGIQEMVRAGIDVTLVIDTQRQGIGRGSRMQSDTCFADLLVVKKTDSGFPEKF